jgi:hypothetical protein
MPPKGMNKSSRELNGGDYLIGELRLLVSQSKPATVKSFEATGQRKFESPVRCESAFHRSGDLARAIAVQLGAIHKKGEFNGQ